MTLTQKNILLLSTLLLAIISCGRQSFHQDTEKLEKTEDFQAFYNRFTGDSSFQISRVRFPIHGRYMDGETVGLDSLGHETSDSKIWTKDNWEIIHPITGIDKSEYEVEKINTDSLVQITIKGKDFGFFYQETYRIENGNWYLTGLTDISL